MSESISHKIIEQIAEKAIDFHCHGVGRFDFTEISKLDLQEIEDILAPRKQRSMLTLYLPQQNFECFKGFMKKFSDGKRAGKFTHIAGIGLEGPLLASHGGTPAEGVWIPTKQQWKELADCGRLGLIYQILSPDASLPGTSHTAPSVEWIAETLLEGGVLPAPGHFTKTNPIESARALQSIFNVVKAWGRGPTITDHLFNDMPHCFKHAWRTPEEKAHHDQDIQEMHLESWTLDTLEEKLGPVPAVMIRNARKGLVKTCQNFDGEHVDFSIIKQSINLIGAENMLMMTDSIESKCLAGKKLSMKEGSTLLYQEEGVVAAGTQNTLQQVENMFSIGLSIQQVEIITHVVPSSILNQHDEYIKSHFLNEVVFSS
jgi:hypothetical protein